VCGREGKGESGREREVVSGRSPKNRSSPNQGEIEIAREIERK
jgi:hypothetical protein